MDNNNYIGEKVLYREHGEDSTSIAEAVIVELNEDYIHISKNGDKSRKLVYPKSFCKVNGEEPFLYAVSKRLKKKVEQDSADYVCHDCGNYEISLQDVQGTKICKKCLDYRKNGYAICCNCNRKAEVKLGYRNEAKMFYCDKCKRELEGAEYINIYDKIYKPGILVGGTNITQHCRRNNHKIKCVNAKVKFLDGRNHIMNLLYCEECNRIMCLLGVLYNYEERFGKALFERKYDEDALMWHKLKRDFDYNPDSILSRWGYAADGSQTKIERRLILSIIIENDDANKPEVETWLNTLIETRGDRCRKAIHLWRDDLMFVCDYDTNDPLIDLTEFDI